MWEQVKPAMVESVREVCSSVRVGGGKPRKVWWNDQVKVVVKRSEAAWKEVLGAKDEYTKERCMEIYKEEMRKVEGVYIKARRKLMKSLEGRRIKM